MFRSYQGSRLALSLVAGVGFTVGCTFGANVTEQDPCESGDNNHLDGEDCECNIGYSWCDAADPDSLECCDDDTFEPCESGTNNHLSGGECYCDAGYDWCTADTEDLNCCGSGGTDSSGDSDSTGNGDSDSTGGDDGTPPPDSCEPGQEGNYWCTHDEDMGPEGSQFYICEGEEWVEHGEFADETCVGDGADFGYGCFDDGTQVVFPCGYGSGTACDGDVTACADPDVLEACKWGKSSETSCLMLCTVDGIDGEQFDCGVCGEQQGESQCLCSDIGAPGCD